MDYINFGETKDSVSKVILGLMRTSDMRVDELTGLCRAAFDEGINFFDTADCYANGRAEELLGEVFQRDSGLRDKVFLQSKCGIRNEDGITWYDFSREHIISAVEASLSRLKTDHLDSLLLTPPNLKDKNELKSVGEIGERLIYYFFNCWKFTIFGNKIL